MVTIKEATEKGLLIAVTFEENTTKASEKGNYTIASTGGFLPVGNGKSLALNVISKTPFVPPKK